MRSSKSRSRSKSNRPRPMGNIVNRVFDSSGPDGKVRGTPQQIIEKYLFLARDAQLSNDRVSAENFNQHAEHYTRMLAEAQRELAVEQEARQNQPGYNQGGGGGQNNGNNQNNGNTQQPQQNRPARDDQRRDERGEPRRDDRGEDRRDDSRDARREERGSDQHPDARSRDAAHSPQPEVIDLASSNSDDTGLVETPETRPRHAPRRKPSAEFSRPAPAPRADAPEDQAAQAVTTSDASEDAAKPDRGSRKPRGPRKPRNDKSQAGADKTPDDSDPREAAE